MKTVIRRGVFETNSSSTHSRSYYPGEDEDGNEGFTFECKTPASRLLMIKSQVNHCLSDLNVERNAKEQIALVKKFYDVCVALFCEKEGVDPSAIEDYLSEQAAKTFYADPDRRHHLMHFKEYYHDESCDLCESFFDSGALRDCECLYEDVKTFLRGFFRCGTDETALREKAEKLLYGANDFVITEYYAGFMLIDTQHSF